MEENPDRRPISMTPIKENLDKRPCIMYAMVEDSEDEADADGTHFQRKSQYKGIRRRYVEGDEFDGIFGAG
jgi:hypothetical protein